MILIVIISLFSALGILKLFVHRTNARCKSKVCLIGKTALITGGNSGLGLELARELASRGCTIIIADKDDATSSVSELIKQTRNLNITAKKVDFTSFKSIRMFAEEIKNDVENLHILVNNVGMGDISVTMTEDGIQKIMQVNYFGHFLLTHLLLGLLLKSAPSRIIYTSSIAAYCSNLSENNFKYCVPDMTTLFNSTSYGNSKLAIAVMSRTLAKKLRNTGVTSNSCHPGLVKTKIWNYVTQSNYISIAYIWLIWTYIFGKSSDDGVQTLLHLACANEVENISGKFFMECLPVWQPKQVYNTDWCNKIWELSEKYVHLKPNEKLEEILQQCRTNI